MKLRIALWALAGTLIAAAWATYAYAAGPVPMLAHPAVWSFARLTCPLVLVADYFHAGVSVFWTLIANALTYGLMGFIVESLRPALRHAH